MKLYVMRHGAAEDQAESGQDFDRALTPIGRERVLAVAKALLEANEEPNAILTSPLVRAVQTAEIVAIGTRLGDRNGTVATRRRLASGSGEAWDVVRDVAHGPSKRVMLVGHEPDLSELVARLLGRGLPFPFGKGMVVGLALDPQTLSARLRFALDAKTLAFDPDRR